MPEAPKLIRLSVLVVFALCLAVFASSSQANQGQSTGDGQAKAAPAKAAQSAENVGSPRPSDPNLYAGSEACGTCHEDICKSHEKGAHAKTELNKNAALKGCEGCHGPGKAHAEGGGDTTTIVSFKNLSKAESTRICLDCHQRNEEHANFLRSRHGSKNVGCVDCHSPHKARTDARLLKAGQPQLCYRCHQDMKPDSGKPSHHKMNEGQTGCRSCHNPHLGDVSRNGQTFEQVEMPVRHASVRRPWQGVYPLAEVQVRTGEIHAVGRLWVRPQTVLIPNLLEES